jgi:hypothetical protein
MDHGVSPTINERPLLFYIMYSPFLQTDFISIQALTRSATYPGGDILVMEVPGEDLQERLCLYCP